MDPVIRLRRLRIIVFEKSLSDAHAEDKCFKIDRGMVF